jgi:hypothetical protein
MVTSNTVMTRLLTLLGSYILLYNSIRFLHLEFLASILLNVQDRYIGISFTALTIAIIYLYISDVNLALL